MALAAVEGVVLFVRKTLKPIGIQRKEYYATPVITTIQMLKKLQVTTVQEIIVKGQCLPRLHSFVLIVTKDDFNK